MYEMVTCLDALLLHITQTQLYKLRRKVPGLQPNPLIHRNLNDPILLEALQGLITESQNNLGPLEVIQFNLPTQP